VLLRAANLPCGVIVVTVLACGSEPAEPVEVATEFWPVGVSPETAFEHEPHAVVEVPGPPSGCETLYWIRVSATCESVSTHHGNHSAELGSGVTHGEGGEFTGAGGKCHVSSAAYLSEPSEGWVWGMSIDVGNDAVEAVFCEVRGCMSPRLVMLDPASPMPPGVGRTVSAPRKITSEWRDGGRTRIVHGVQAIPCPRSPQ